MPQCKTKPSDLGSLFLTHVWKAGEREQAVSIPSWLWSLWFSSEKTHKCSASPNDWSYQRAWETSPVRACAQLSLTLMRVVSMKKRGSLFVCAGLAFTARSLAQTWPTILIGFWGLIQWVAPRYERQRAQHNSTSSGTISFSGSLAKAPILHPFWWLFSIKTDSKLWHKRFQTYHGYCQWQKLDVFLIVWGLSNHFVPGGRTSLW